jgi:type II secretory pathway pseudopilin PulG
MTLIEVVIAVSLLSVVVLIVMGTLHRTNSEAVRMHDLVEARQSAREAVQLLERDIRMSGSGWGRIPVNAWNGGLDTLYAIQPGPGAGADDSLQVVGAWSASTSLSSAMPFSTSTLAVANVAGFAPNDMIVLTDGSTAHLFQVTGVTASNLDHTSSSPWNPTVSPGFANWPAGGYGAGARVYKVTIVSYAVDSTNFRRPALTRREFGGQPQVVAYDVNQFQVWYRMQDSSMTRSPSLTGAIQIDKVRPIVFTRLVTPNRPTYVDSLWSEIQPRTF